MLAVVFAFRYSAETFLPAWLCIDALWLVLLLGFVQKLACVGAVRQEKLKQVQVLQCATQQELNISFNEEHATGLLFKVVDLKTLQTTTVSIYILLGCRPEDTTTQSYQYLDDL